MKNYYKAILVIVVSVLQSCTSNVAHVYPEQPLWGDTHVHTNISMDAFSLGNTHLGPAAAYEFAKGNPVTLASGKTAILDRPLDFLVVADHAEYLGISIGLTESNQTLLENEKAKEWHYHMHDKNGDHQLPMMEWAASLSSGENLIKAPDYYQSVWREMVDLAETANDPGKFTALAGYEWSSAPGGNNLHRVVVFKDGVDKLSQHMPFSALDSDNPEDLWSALKSYEEATGGEVLTIPHNSNISGGRMFEDVTFNGEEIDIEYAKTRAHFEKIVEVTQVKGDSETHPFLSPDDEFADFERWDRSNVGMSEKHKDEWFEGEYARSALKKGLKIEERIGVNPYQFGMIGSTDQHNSLSNVDEANFPGKFTIPGPGKDRWKFTIAPETIIPQVYYEWELAAAGYAAVWAEENTREGIFDALKRRETYATSGPRMNVRFFAGIHYDANILSKKNWVGLAYKNGTSMGGQLFIAPDQSSPTFLIQAFKDPQGANLQRAQIIKGWTDNDGESNEKVYDISIAEDESDGISEIKTLWKDPDFDATQRAFYYVRVLQVPTPRWTTYDIEKYGADIPKNVPRFIQERSYTSPIWFSPEP